MSYATFMYKYFLKDLIYTSFFIKKKLLYFYLQQVKRLIKKHVFLIFEVF